MELLEMLKITTIASLVFWTENHLRLWDRGLRLSWVSPLMLPKLLGIWDPNRIVIWVLIFD
jgi:hypothetical protein